MRFLSRCATFRILWENQSAKLTALRTTFQKGSRVALKSISLPGSRLRFPGSPRRGSVRAAPNHALPRVEPNIYAWLLVRPRDLGPTSADATRYSDAIWAILVLIHKPFHTGTLRALGILENRWQERYGTWPTKP